MGRARKIDIAKAIEMRVGGATLRDIGAYFNVSAEAVRQAFDRVQKKKREQKKLARLLVAASIDEQGAVKSPKEISQTIDEWATIVEAAKKGIALESEVASLKERFSKIEENLPTTDSNKTRAKSSKRPESFQNRLL